MGFTKVDKLQARELKEGSRSVPSGTAVSAISDAGDTTANPSATTVGAAVSATAPTNSSPYGFGQQQATDIIARINELRADVLALRASVATLETDGDAYTDRINKLIDCVDAFQMTD